MPYKDKNKQRAYKRIWEANKRKENKLKVSMEPGTLEPNMEPKFVEPKPRKSMEPKRVEPKEPKIVKQIWEHLQQEKLERVLFHYEISEMVREWQQGISEIKHTIKELISQKQVPIVRTSREKKTEPNTRERKRKSLLPPSGLKYKSSEWWKWYNAQPHRQEYRRRKREESRLKKE